MGEVILERKKYLTHVMFHFELMLFHLAQAGPQKGPEKILSVTLKSAKSSLLFNICNGGTCTLTKCVHLFI